MPVPSESITAGPFYPNGSTTTFPFGFRALSASELVVIRVVGGVESEVSQALFGVTLNDVGGSVIFDTAPMAGGSLLIRSAPAWTQDIEITDEGAFLPSVLTEGLDRAAMRDLVLLDKIESIEAGAGGEVTEEAIVGALGYVPASPADLAEKADSTATSLALAGKANNATVATKVDAAGARVAAVQDQIGAETTKAPSQAAVASALATSTFASPAVTLPASTKMLDLRGHDLPGDRYDFAAYREVALQPSHPGKLQKDGKWYELTDEFAVPDKFYRTGDTNDAASFLRARDFMLRKTGPVVLQLQPRVYDCNGVTLDFAGIAAQIIGAGFTESGNVGGFNTNYQTGFTEAARGSWIRAGVAGSPPSGPGQLPPPALSFSGGNARGARIDRVGFVQSHPTPTTGWAPTNYGFLIQAMNASGGLDIGTIMLAGINRGIFSDNSGRLTIDRLRGQTFTDGILVDHAYDVTYLNHVHLWPYGAFSTPITAYMQGASRGLRLGRCDGVHIGHFFQILGFRAHSFEGYRTNNAGTGGLTFRGLPESEAMNSAYGSLPNGPVTDFFCENLYADATKVAVYGASANINAAYSRLTSQCENVPEALGLPLANSAAIKLDSSAPDGLITVGSLHCERATNVVKNVSSTSIDIVHPVFARYLPNSSQLFSATGGAAVGLHKSPIWPQNCPAGAYGVDFTTTDDQLVYTYQTTTNSQGAIVMPHGLGNVTGRVRDCFVHFKGNSGESSAMDYLGLDGDYLYAIIKSSNPSLYGAGRIVRVTLRLGRFSDNW